jgi:Protein of unknown function (DUF1493)
MDIIFERIKNFVESKRWKYKFPLTRITRVEEDLGIYGDDANEFLIAFGQEFNVDMSKFMAGDYFSDETAGAAGTIMRFFSWNNKPNKKTLTLGHLEKAVAAGRLDEDVINS